jgi:hypothetical protein
MKAELTAYLLAATPLTALVGQRIVWLKRPQGSTLPAITLQTASAPRDYTMQGRVGLVGYLVQFDIWGATYKQTQQVLAVLVPVLDALRGAPFQGAFIENERETYEPQDAPDGSGSTDFFRTSLDVRVFHQPA